MIKVRQGGKIHWARFPNIYLHIRRETTGGNSIRGKIYGDEKGKSSRIGGCKHKEAKKPDSIYDGLGYIQLPFIHLVSKNNNKKWWNYLRGIAY